MTLTVEKMQIPYRDLSVTDAKLKADLIAAVETVLSHGRFILGPEVTELEDRLAEYCGRRYAVGVASGTDALYLALKSLGVGPGDEVITTPMSWIATLNAIALCGAEPVFVDITEDLNIDAELVEQAITRRTKAILPVHYTGRLCDMERIGDITARHDVALVEDAAQAFGARLHDRPAGAFGKVSCFSMNPMKVFCGYGEAGAIVTDDADVAERVRSLRYAGTVEREDCHWPSLNGRTDTIQAAMLLVSLEYLPEVIERRRRIAQFYSNALAQMVTCPTEKAGEYHIHYTYTILAQRRDQLKQCLAEQGIETKIHHPLLMPDHSAYRGRFKADIPVARRLVGRILSIPNQHDLSEQQTEYVADAIRSFYARG